MDAVRTESYKGYRIEVFQDEDPENPREWDNVGHMICFHKRYDLGDKTDLKSNNFSGWGDLEKYLINKKRAAIILPLYLLDHSGITMRTRSFSDVDPGEWDSGQVGFIYCTAGEIKREWGTGPDAKEKAESYLRGEVKTYDQYLTGEVYGYQVTKNGKDVDSCWGNYDDPDDIIKEQKAGIDNTLKQQHHTAYVAQKAAKAAKKVDSALGTSR